MELRPELLFLRSFRSPPSDMFVSAGFVVVISLLILRQYWRWGRKASSLCRVAKVHVVMTSKAPEQQEQKQPCTADVQGVQSPKAETTEAQADAQGEQRPKEKTTEAQEQKERHEDKRNTRVRFEAKVSAVHVPDLMDLQPEQKEWLWWQPHNFDEFLAMRVELGHAYREAAKALGVPMSQVTIFGSHEEDGYQAMIEKFPQLADESRRGLGLGRKRQRAMNRDAYVAAVVEEHARQREEAGSSAFKPDFERMAAVASTVSKKDRDFAAKMAKAYYEQDREKDLLEGPQASAGDETSHSSAATRAYDGLPELPEHFDFGPPVSESKATELACNLADEVIHGSENKLPTPSRFTKGFGLDRNTLHKAGLSITGHPLLRRQHLGNKRYTCPALKLSPLLADSDGGSEFSDSGADTSAETDGSDDFAGLRRSQSEWVHGAELRARAQSESLHDIESRSPTSDQVALMTDARAYGSREQYRLWRMAALDEKRQADADSPIAEAETPRSEVGSSSGRG